MSHPMYGCNCCECQGKMCLMWHPGHSHRGDLKIIEDLIERSASLMPQHTCKTCEKPKPVEYWLYHRDDQPGEAFCSISCLLEYAWRIKEAQPKLSKSKD